MTASDGSTPKHSHYHKDVSPLDTVDVYRMCALFNVDDSSGATQHAIKKLLCSGKRGVKNVRQDLQEAVDTINRRIQMIDEDAGWTESAIKDAALPCNNPVRAFHSDPMPEPAAAMEDDSERMQIIGQCGEMAEEVYAAVDAADPFAGAPEWAQWKAQDEDGEWWFYSERPGAIDEDSVWSVLDGSTRKAHQAYEPNPNWRDTLIQRRQP